MRKLALILTAFSLLGLLVWSLQRRRPETVVAPITIAPPVSQVQANEPAQAVPNQQATATTDTVAPSVNPPAITAILPTASNPISVATTPSPSAPIAQHQSLVSGPSIETAATRRMYGAHAPLRTDAVVNPDSVENQEILNRMVQKALQNQNSRNQSLK